MMLENGIDDRGRMAVPVGKSVGLFIPCLEEVRREFPSSSAVTGTATELACFPRVVTIVGFLACREQSSDQITTTDAVSPN